MEKITMRQYIDYESCAYTYLLYDPNINKSVIIDPVLKQYKRDMGIIKKLDLDLIGILETHVHADHITGAFTIREKNGTPVYYGSETGVQGADFLLNDGDRIQVGQFEIKTIHTPGHTKGCVSYYTCGMLFTGDTLFIGGTGSTDFQDGDHGMEYDRVSKKLFLYHENT